MAADPAVTRAAIDAIRRELRARTGGRMAGPPPDLHGAHDMPPPDHGDEGSPEEEQHESPQEMQAEGDVKCPECGFVFKPPDEDDGKAGDTGDEGHGKEALLLIPKGGEDHGEE